MFLEDLFYSLIDNADKRAFCVGDVYYSYRQLYDAAAAIKAQIETGRRDKEKKNIAVVASDDFLTYASLLGIWFSGCAYVPLGLHNPPDRNLSILKDADAGLILSTIALDAEAYAEYTVLTPSAGEGVRAGEAREAAEPTRAGGNKLTLPDLRDEDLAYILFTSGSTGLPKGVPITYKSLDAFTSNFASTPFDVRPDDRCLQMFELTFDVSISSFLPPLLCGACVYTVPNNAIKYVHVLKLLQNYQLSSIQIVPSIIRLARPLLKKLHFPGLRNCILTGEATHADLLEEWKKVVPNARLFDFYGPTEATIYCSWYECGNGPVKEYNGMLAIGKPMGEMQLAIVDETGAALGPNEKGELLIGGSQVTPGYINNPEKNAAAFMIHGGGSRRDGGGQPGESGRYYRSGDLCYKDEAGDIYYCGRLDNQVKVQGFRVELTEIEVVVRNRFAINNVVIPIEQASGVTELVLVVEKNAGNDNEAIRAYLRTRLPVYMLPGKVIEMDTFPLGSSGKMDKKKIKELVLHEL